MNNSESCISIILLIWVFFVQACVRCGKSCRAHNNPSGRLPWKFVVVFLNLLNIYLCSCPKNKCALVKVPISRIPVKPRLCCTGERGSKRWRGLMMAGYSRYSYLGILSLSKFIRISFLSPTLSPSLISRHEKEIWWRNPGMKFACTFLKGTVFF